MTRPSSGRSAGAPDYDRVVAPAERPVRAVAVATALGTAGAGVGILSLVSLLADGSSPAWGGVPAAAVWAVTAVVLVAQSLTQLWGRRLTDAAWLLAAGLPLVVALAVPDELYSVTALPVLVASFRAGLRASVRRLAAWATAAALLVALGHVVNALGLGRTDYAGMTVEALAQAVLVVGAPLLPAAVFRAQREARAAQQDRLDALTRERDAQVGEAVARERTEMARELHDIAAHHLSGIALRAAAVEAQVAADPDAARQGAADIRRQSRAVLDDLRRLVGLLRDTDASDAAVRTLATVPELVHAATAAGMDVTYDARPAPGPAAAGVPPLAQLAAYRLVQESLSNARRHAPGARCTVVVDDTDPRRLSVRVRNEAPAVPGPRSGGGFGIVGMTERASLIGATFDAGPTPDGGWETRMDIPRTAGRTGDLS